MKRLLTSVLFLSACLCAHADSVNALRRDRVLTKKCETCHTRTSPGIVHDWEKSLHAKAKVTCIDCHETPHRESFVTLSSKLAKVATKDTCALCHSAEHETFVGPKVAMTPRLHGASGFSLNKPHEKVECSKCHKEFGKREALAEGPRLATEFAALFPGRALRQPL